MESSQKLTSRWEKLGYEKCEAKAIDLYADWFGVQRRKISPDALPLCLKMCCECCSERAEAPRLGQVVGYSMAVNEAPIQRRALWGPVPIFDRDIVREEAMHQYMKYSLR